MVPVKPSSAEGFWVERVEGLVGSVFGAASIRLSWEDKVSVLMQPKSKDLPLENAATPTMTESVIKHGFHHSPKRVTYKSTKAIHRGKKTHKPKTLKAEVYSLSLETSVLVLVKIDGTAI